MPTLVILSDCIQVRLVSEHIALYSGSFSLPFHHFWVVGTDGSCQLYELRPLEKNCSNPKLLMRSTQSRKGGVGRRS